MSPIAPEQGAIAAGRRRLSRLMAVRLAMALGVFAMAVGLFGADDAAAPGARGLYGVIALAFVATALFAALLGRVRNLSAFAALQVGVDIALVTAVLLCSGGGRSIFSFLYLPIVVLAAVLLQRRGGYAAAAGSSFGYGFVLVAGAHGFTGRGMSEPFEVQFALWGVYSGALLVAALLAGALVRDLDAAGRRLQASRTELRRLEDLYARVVASLTSGLMTTDASGHIATVNPEGERILARSAAALRGRPLSAVLPGSAELLHSSSGQRSRSRLIRDTPKGPQFLGVAVSKLQGGEDLHRGHVVIFQDVTSVVRLEEELQRNARLAGVGELSASIAHEIRNPLAAISGSVEMLRTTEGDAPDRERLMAIALREIRRLDDLISDFLRYARPAEPKFQTLDLARLISEQSGMSERVAGEIQFEVDVPEGLSAWADGDQLLQVLWNLVRNAEQAIEGSGRIRIAAAPETPQGDDRSGRKAKDGGSRFVEITISDSGPGIDPAVADRIFDPFFTTKPGGTGLGLPTVHRIVEAHGGSIQVESRPGVGTHFHVRLPADRAAWGHRDV